MAGRTVEKNAVGGIAIVDEPCDVLETSQPFGKRWRDQVVTLSAEHLRALQEGHYVAVDVQEEYVVFLRLEEEIDPDAGQLGMTAGGGHAGTRGVCMPGRGKVEERSAKDEERGGMSFQAMNHGQDARATSGDAVTLDVCLNDTAYWSNVPPAVWDCAIGGYRVIKKWLSYREKTMLGRGLKMEETECVTEMARRIAALFLLQDDFDADYEAVKADTRPWPQT